MIQDHEVKIQFMTNSLPADHTRTDVLNHEIYIKELKESISKLDKAQNLWINLKPLFDSEYFVSQIKKATGESYIEANKTMELIVKTVISGSVGHNLK